MRRGNMVGVAQLVRAPGCGPGGRGFDSHRSPHSRQIAGSQASCQFHGVFCFSLFPLSAFLDKLRRGDINAPFNDI